jgi:hypothetical protein
MTETLRIFVQSDGPDSQQVDAAHGLEPPPPPPPPEPDYGSLAVWEMIVHTSSSMTQYWSFDLRVLEEALKRWNLHQTEFGRTHVQIRRLDPKLRWDSKSWLLHAPLSPRNFHVGCLDLGRDYEQCFTKNGYWNLGKIADMSWTDWKKISFTPDECRVVQDRLAKHGLSLSFELFPGERTGWSKKRLSA